MANQEQINMLKQDVIICNLWREEHFTEEVSLSGSRLSKADLHEAILVKREILMRHICSFKSVEYKNHEYTKNKPPNIFKMFGGVLIKIHRQTKQPLFR